MAENRERRNGNRGHSPKGRQIEAEALQQICDLIGREDLRRDLLIEYLHRIQDCYGYLSASHLAALAAEMRLSQAEVYEMATFYAHFDVVKEGDTPPPSHTVRVCDGIACDLAGCQDLHRSLASSLGSSVRVIRTPCIGACNQAPVAVVRRRQIGEATVEKIQTALRSGKVDLETPKVRSLEESRANGDYQALTSLRRGEISHAQALEIIDASGLRGLGGAGFPVARKWRFLLEASKPRLMAVNADEGEPGTFKDRYCLETDPHRVLEGALTAAHCIEAEAVYIYLRDEYPHLHRILSDEISKVEASGLADGVALHLRRGAGAYICGEETAMLESIEGKRGLPRNRPPFPAERGLFGKPTLIHNVETLFWLPSILERGAEWYQAAGRPRFYSVSGRVQNPGIKLAPSGVTARRLIEEYCGGMLGGHTFKAYLPGGASGGILPADLADLPLDFGSLDEHGCFVGSGAVIVLSDRDSIRDVVRNLLSFFEDESCGQCTPCRVGCEKMLQLINGEQRDSTLITELSETMRDASICGLGQAAPNPVLSAYRFFEAEIQ